jgi:hypothetical protein
MIPSRSIVGRPRHQGVMVGMGQKDSYVGYVPPSLGLRSLVPVRLCIRDCPALDAGLNQTQCGTTDQVHPPTVMKPSRSVVSSPLSTRSSTVSSQTGMTWRRSGTTPSTTNSVSRLRSTPCCSPRLPSTPRWATHFPLEWNSVYHILTPHLHRPTERR